MMRRPHRERQRSWLRSSGAVQQSIRIRRLQIRDGEGREFQRRRSVRNAAFGNSGIEEHPAQPDAAADRAEHCRERNRADDRRTKLELPWRGGQSNWFRGGALRDNGQNLPGKITKDLRQKGG